MTAMVVVAFLFVLALPFAKLLGHYVSQSKSLMTTPDKRPISHFRGFVEVVTHVLLRS